MVRRRERLRRPLMPLPRRTALLVLAACVVAGVAATAWVVAGGERDGDGIAADGVVPGAGTSTTTTPSTPTSATPTSATPTSAGAGGTTSTARAGGTSPATSAVPVTGVPVTTAPGPGGERVHVKFAEGSGARLRDGRLVSVTGADLAGAQAVLDRHQVVRLERLFARPEADLDAERAAAEARTGTSQPDLNLYFRVVMAPGAPAAPLIAALAPLAGVEAVYREPGAAPPPGGP